MNKKTSTKTRLAPRKLEIVGDGKKEPIVKKATYYIEKTPIQGESSQITTDASRSPLMTQAQASAEMHRLHAEDPRSSYDVIRRSDGIPFDRVDADYSAHVSPSTAALTNLDPSSDSAVRVPPQVVARVTRPEVYIVEVENLPVSISRVKGRQSGRILCGRVADARFNPLHDRLRSGETRTQSSVSTTVDTFRFDTMAGWYYFCVDIKEALRAKGFKSTGNYQRAIWTHTPPAADPTLICSVTSVTHLEKVTSPDYKLPKGHTITASAAVSTDVPITQEKETTNA